MSVSQSINRCSHGWYIPTGESTARDLNGRAYCSGCECQGGAFVLADGHAHTGGCSEQLHHLPEFGSMCSFGRDPIYDHRNYCDVTGNEEWYKASLYPAQQQTIQDRLQEIDPDFRNGECAEHPPATADTKSVRLNGWLCVWPQDGWNTELWCVWPQPQVVADKEEKIAVPASWRGPWQRLKPSVPDWVRPSFIVIPILDHSQPKYAKPFINFCPDCFTRRSDRKKQLGLYVPQLHDCGERNEYGDLVQSTDGVPA